MYLQSKDKKEKYKILAFIRNKGSGLRERTTGKVKPVKALRNGIEKKKIQCEMCEGRFSEDTLWHHKKYCFGYCLKNT